MKSDSQLIKDFKKKWERVSAFERDEARKLSLRQKFRQIASLMRMGRGLGLDFHEDEEKLAVRSRWILLKKDRG